VLGSDEGCWVSGDSGIVVAEDVALDTAEEAVAVAYWQRLQMDLCLGRSARDLKLTRGGMAMVRCDEGGTMGFLLAAGRC